jgi:hypothetical protein
MSETRKQGRFLALGLGALQAFIGLGAVGAGLAMVLDPSGANLGMPLDWLGGTPFPDYLVPGVVLLVVNGLGSLTGAVASFTRYRYAGEIAMALGAFLIIWIVAQVWWIGLSSWLQPSYFGFGVVELVLGWQLRKELSGFSQA